MIFFDPVPHHHILIKTNMFRQVYEIWYSKVDSHLNRIDIISLQVFFQ